MSVPFRLDYVIFAGHARSNDRYVVLLVAHMLHSHAARIARFEFFTFGIAQRIYAQDYWDAGKSEYFYLFFYFYIMCNTFY